MKYNHYVIFAYAHSFEVVHYVVIYLIYAFTYLLYLRRKEHRLSLG